MKEIELINLRREREKHFLKNDGNIVAMIYDDDIHFRNNDTYEEIDNTLIKGKEYYENKNNAYKVYFKLDSSGSFMKMKRLDNYIEFSMLECNKVPITKEKNVNKLYELVKYENIIDRIDFEYEIMPTKVKEKIIIKEKNNIDKISFFVKTNLNLLCDGKRIQAKNEDELLFVLEAPFMIDSDKVTNNNIYYNLSKLDDGYKLELLLDEEWLKKSCYPVIIDPTITNSGQNNSVYDTYIYPGDTLVDRNSQDVLKVGVEKINGQDIINRSLIKFELPVIGTGSQVVDARLFLTGYFYNSNQYNGKIINVHNVTQSWDETTATWESMHDNYNNRKEATFVDTRDGVYIYNDVFNITQNWVNCANITNLVRKWYSNTPNYGIMLKLNDEVYTTQDIPMFFSKNNTITGTNPKPILAITYRNQNGLEKYMNYKIQNFSIGKAYVNSYNGNLTTVFQLGKTIGGHLPASLNLVYNTNDVVLNNNIGYGIGYRLDLQQTIKQVIIDDITQLEYVDADGTIHYFREKNGEYVGGGDVVNSGTGPNGQYIDEDGLDLVVEENQNEYIMRDKNNNIKRFSKNSSLAFLTQIEDTMGNTTNIYYNNNNTISRIVDSNNQEIAITYGTNTITISCNNESTYINYSNNIVSEISNSFGTIQFTYDTIKNIITIIEDTDGFKISYEYYDEIPYRIKKVSEFGQNNTIGKSLSITYGYDSTTITDHKNRVETMTFNSYGNLISKNNLKLSNDLKNAYGMQRVYGESYTTGYGEYTRYKNKIVTSNPSNKYVKNYLLNTSFESENILFNSSINTVLSIAQTDYRTGIKSLKAVNSSINEFLSQTVSVPKGYNYTFSAYLKNSNKVRLALSYIDSNNMTVETISQVIDSENDFCRQEITIFYPEDAISDLTIKIYLDEIGVLYVDDIQLEEGEVANKYNMIENSDFSSGLNGWSLSCYNIETEVAVNPSDVFEVVTLPNNNYALKICMDPANYSSLSREFNINGCEGDTYNISFWYKDEGYLGEVGYDSSILNDASVIFNYTDTSTGFGVFPNKTFMPNESEWQYFSGNFIAYKDYDKITLKFNQRFNANNFYIANICMFKDAREVSYDYDDSGNIKSVQNLNLETSSYDYDKNAQMVRINDYQNKKYCLEYHNVITDRVLQGITSDGICYKIKYDEKGNPIYNSTSSISFDDLNGLYKIRLKGTDSFIGYASNNIKIGNEYKYCLWEIQANGDYYTINHSILLDKYFNSVGQELTINSFNNDNSLFSLIKQDNGSYLIKLKSYDKYLKHFNNSLVIETLTDGDPDFEFYLEKHINDLFLEENSEYSPDGRFITSNTSTVLNKTLYNVNSNTGLLTSIINAKGNSVFYNYNNDNLVSISQGNKLVTFGYNLHNMLSTVNFNNKQYKFLYDDFFRIKNVKLGDNILFLTNNYEVNNGNLSSINYGNNNVISYLYDNFDRLTSTICMDDTYNYKYDNNGDLVKITSNKGDAIFIYDLGKRLTEYRYNDFRIKYIYDLDNRLSSIRYKLDNNNEIVTNVFGVNNKLSSITFDDSSINYNYDSLGRVSTYNINNQFNVGYEYVTNGKRTSLLIKSICFNNEIYTYKYDELENITHIYHNNKLENKYYYDEFNQLIKEKDYINQTFIKYSYDMSGNILSKKIYDLSNYNLISNDIYQYNNSEWEDQLTSFNNNTITYDSIGNPLTIGNNISIGWTNGKQLSSFTDLNNTINYKYNSDGIRIEKDINSVKTYYYLQGKDIIFEKTNGNVIYYIRSSSDGLIGFKYNNATYYYIKNLQNDIIGILDENNNVIARYYYDSWGNSIAIVDGNGNDISNQNNHVANINPFRYRCYYYDNETKLYYLNTRYYNPLWGRFLNADNVLGSNRDVLSYNLYSYCSNNPIMCTDEDGKGIIRSVIKTVKKAVKAIKSAVKTVATVVKNVTKKAVNVVSNLVSKPFKQTTQSSNKTTPTPSKQEVDTSSLPDYTEELNRVLITNASEAFVIRDSFSPQNILSYFYHQVKNEGPWDYKRKQQWEEDIDVPYLGNDGKFLYNGKVTTAEDFGNINYGFVGTVLGISPEVLYMGGGYAAQDGICIEIFKAPYYGDAENDHYSIKRGIEMYYNEE